MPTPHSQTIKKLSKQQTKNNKNDLQFTMHANAVLVTSLRVIYFRRFNFPPKAAGLKPTSWCLKWSKVPSWCNICVFPYHWPHCLLLSKGWTSNPYIACLIIHPHALNHLVPMGISVLLALVIIITIFVFFIVAVMMWRWHGQTWDKGGVERSEGIAQPVLTGRPFSNVVTAGQGRALDP